jgi:hypothetical protein
MLSEAIESYSCLNSVIDGQAASSRLLQPMVELELDRMGSPITIGYWAAIHIDSLLYAHLDP